MSVKDFGSENRWYIAKEFGALWGLYSPHNEQQWEFHTFSEAHAAYLDAVTCEEVTPFLNYSNRRCSRSRGHRGPHWFATPVGLMPLVVNQK